MRRFWLHYLGRYSTFLTGLCWCVSVQLGSTLLTIWGASWVMWWLQFPSLVVSTGTWTQQNWAHWSARWVLVFPAGIKSCWWLVFSRTFPWPFPSPGIPIILIGWSKLKSAELSGLWIIAWGDWFVKTSYAGERGDAGRTDVSRNVTDFLM